MDRQFPASERWTYVLIVVALFSSASWAAGPTVAFDIPPGPAPQTLRQFYLQSQVRVLYLVDAVKDVRTQPVSGELEASTALAQMLQGTGLSYEFEGEYAAVIKSATVVASKPYATTIASLSSAGSSIAPVSDAPRKDRVEEVLVTGSLIHGVFDSTSPLIVLERKEMRRTSYATVQNAVQTLPLASSVTRGEVFGGAGNFNRGSAINLRGLGDVATLVLVDGRRQPAAGMDADFVDVSLIPWSMVDRIEVLPDGGSALYGSDAIAGIVNIVLRQTLEGAETQLRLGTAPSGASELLAAQLVGHNWDSGHWLAGYQYYERTSLAAADRRYTANTDKRPLGGSDHRGVANNPGNILDPQTLRPVFAIPQGQDGTSLSAGDLLPGTVNYRNYFDTVDLLPDTRTHSAYFTASQDLSEHVQLFAEGRYGQRDIHLRPAVADQLNPLLIVPATNPFFVDPFGGAPFVVVAYDFYKDLGPFRGSGRTRNYLGSLGLKADFDDSWQASLSASYGAESLRWTDHGQVNPFALSAVLADPDPATALNPFGDGSHTNPSTLRALRFDNRLAARSEISAVQVTADGSLFAMPSGVTKLAIGAEYRRESLLREFPDLLSSLAPRRTHFSRQVSALFTELALPLIGNPTGSRAAPRLELSLAGRYEHYDDSGSTFNPKIGIRWAPLAAVKLRASWGTAFRAPNLVDLNTRNGSALVSLADPRSPTGRAEVLAIAGGNPQLQEERATSWTAGFDLAPPHLPGFRLSLTGYAIDYEDQVVVPGQPNLFDILLHEDELASVITRNPSQAQIDAVCGSMPFFGDPAQCTTARPSVLFDGRMNNLAATKVRGLDLTLSQSLDTAAGRFNVELNGTYVLDFKRAFTQTARLVDVVDTVNNPPALRLRGTVEWQQRGPQQPGFTANLTTHYTGSYRDRESLVQHSVAAWTTFDLGLSYRTGKRGGWMDDTELVLNAVNVLNTDPPFVDRMWGYDVFNAQPVGRVVSAYVSKRW